MLKRKEDFTRGVYFYEQWDAGSKKEALEYLATRIVEKKYYYIIVDTPEGSFGKDIDGIYDETKAGSVAAIVDSLMEPKKSLGGKSAIDFTGPVVIFRKKEGEKKI